MNSVYYYLKSMSKINELAFEILGRTGFLICLRELAMKTGDGSRVKLTTTQIGEKVGVSQQTASRILSQIIEYGWVNRSSDHTLQTSLEGLKRLIAVNSYIHNITRNEEIISITGNSVIGLGQGAYYVSRPNYVTQFISKLGFEPFPGTFNIKLETMIERAKILFILDTQEFQLIQGFETDERVFGAVKCYPVKINGHKGAIIVPDRSHYSQETIEIISDISLRDKFKIAEGDETTVEYTVREH